MSNYLANIAARTINTAPPVRPRLRGRFDPVASPGDGAIDQSMVDRTFARAPVNEIEGPTPDVQRDASGGSAKLSIDRLKQEPSSSIPQPESEATDSRTTGVHVAETRPLPVPILNATIEAKPPPQSTSDRAYETARPGEPCFTAATSQPASPPIEVTTAIAKPRNEREAASTISKSLEPAQSVQQTQSLGTVELATRFDPQAHPHRSVSERVIEREIQTVVVRENPRHVDSQVQNAIDPPAHRAAATTDGKITAGETRPAPIVIQPRIEPLAPLRPERLSVHQPEQRVEPTVHVTIGRIEVRAVQQPSQPTAKPRATQPVMNLEDYLRRRNQGGAR
jgi:hypothetical protein